MSRQRRTFTPKFKLQLVILYENIETRLLQKPPLSATYIKTQSYKQNKY